MNQLLFQRSQILMELVTFSNVGSLQKVRGEGFGENCHSFMLLKITRKWQYGTLFSH